MDFLYCIVILIVTGVIFLGVVYFFVRSLIDYANKKIIINDA